ncbi:MAG: hypothetical protein JF616_11570 [Fibrobacteres bacterium]|nr:hypothetical protein [Fibrobacterota bacterium]
MRVGLISVFCVAAWCQAEWKSIPPPPVDSAAKEPVWSIVAHDGGLWATTPEGLSLSRDSGRTWRSARPPEFPRSAHSAATSPGGRLFSAAGCLFATASTGLFTTCDDGASWRKDPQMGRIDRLRGDASLLIAGSWDDEKLYASDDKGRTWRTPPSFTPDGMGLDGVFQDGSRLWMSAGSSYYSDDGGKTWHATDAGGVGPSGGYVRLAGQLWKYGPYSEMQNSADSGRTWTQRDIRISDLLGSVYLSGLVFVEGKLFTSGFLSTANYPAGVFMSADSGKTWVPRNQGLPVSSLSPTDSALTGATAVFALGTRLLARTEKGIYRSDDLGAGWQASNAGISAAALKNVSYEDVYVNADRAFRRIEANNQFIWYTSADSALTWRVWNPGISDIASLHFTASTVLAFRSHGDSALADPIYQSKDGMKTWSLLRGPWSSTSAYTLDAIYASGTHIYVSGYVYAGIATAFWHSPDEGATWESDSMQVYGQMLAWHAEAGNARFRNEGAATTVSTDSGHTWKPTLGGGNVEGSAVVGQTLLVRIYDSLFVTSDAGKTWRPSPVEKGNPQLFDVTAFAGRFLVATPQGLRASRNGLDWEDAGETGLSYLYSRAIVLAGNNLMAATNKGLFVSQDLGAHWQPSLVPQGESPSPEPRVAWLAAWKDTFFAGIPNLGVFLSMDSGKTWVRKYDDPIWGMWAGPEDLAFDAGYIMHAPDLIPGAHIWGEGPDSSLDNTELAMADGGLYLSKTSGAFVSNAPGAPWTPVKLPGQAPHDFLAGDGKGLVASAADGLYLRPAANMEWQPIGAGLPKDEVSALSMDGGRLLAGLFTQGLWMNSALPIPIAHPPAQPLLVARPSIYPGADGSLVFRVNLAAPARLRLTLHSAAGRTLADLAVSARPGIQELRPNPRGRGVSFYRLEVEPEAGHGPVQTFRGTLAPFR